jgi:uncharacterized protein YhbP (UPF0306 family)
MGLQELLSTYLDEKHMMQLATVTGGQPWCCTVYYVHDDHNNLYWASLPTRRHSQEIKQNPNVAIAIAVKHVKGEAVVGIQMEGHAQVLPPSKDIREFAKSYAAKFNRDEQWIEDFISGKTEHRLYKFTPKSIYLFDEVNYPGGVRQQVI